MGRAYAQFTVSLRKAENRTLKSLGVAGIAQLLSKSKGRRSTCVIRSEALCVVVVALFCWRSLACEL